jgi:hypothetical protein
MRSLGVVNPKASYGEGGLVKNTIRNWRYNSSDMWICELVHLPAERVYLELT